MYMSDYLENGILLTLSGVPFTAPAAVFITLSSTDPTDNGSKTTEPSYQSYARQRILFDPPSAMSGGIGISNNSEITFPKADNDLPTATFVVLYDSAALGAGNMLAYAELNSPKPIKKDMEPTIRVGEASWWLTGNASTAFATDIMKIFIGTSLPAITPFATLFNGTPGQSGGTELTGGNYARQPVTFGEPVEQANGQRVISNTALILWPDATAALGNYNTDALYDSASGGKLLLYKTGETATFAKGDSVTFGIDKLRYALN